MCWCLSLVVAKLSMYSGVLSLGVGDSIAAVSGTLIGRIKWPGNTRCVWVSLDYCIDVWIKGTRKTVEGTLMSVLSQFLVVASITFLGEFVFEKMHDHMSLLINCLTTLDQDIPSLSQSEWFIVGVAIVGGGVMEAYTHQVDNLVLGIFVFSILIAFL